MLRREMYILVSVVKGVYYWSKRRGGKTVVLDNVESCHAYCCGNTCVGTNAH